MPYKPKVDGILEYILYWCSFGPDDHRMGGIVRPSRSTYVSKNKSAGRSNTKWGCTCHFIVKRLNAEPSVALIIYNQDKHVDKKGLPCHGPQDKKAVGTRAMETSSVAQMETQSATQSENRGTKSLGKKMISTEKMFLTTTTQ